MVAKQDMLLPTWTEQKFMSGKHGFNQATAGGGFTSLTDLWALHLIYSKRDGNKLLSLFLQRFASLTTMLTLLVGTQVATLFSPSTPCEHAREALKHKAVDKVAFWAGLVLCLGIICAILSLIAVLVAWSLYAAVDPNNAHIILRSSISLLELGLPERMAMISIMLFLLWINLFFYVLSSWQVAMPLSVLFSLGLVPVWSLYRSVGRLLMYSGSLGREHVNVESEATISPKQLTETLQTKTDLADQAQIPVHEQYRIRYQEQLRILEEGGGLRLEELRLENENEQEGEKEK